MTVSLHHTTVMVWSTVSVLASELFYDIFLLNCLSYGTLYPENDCLELHDCHYINNITLAFSFQLYGLALMCAGTTEKLY